MGTNNKANRYADKYHKASWLNRYRSNTGLTTIQQSVLLSSKLNTEGRGVESFYDALGVEQECLLINPC